MTGRDSAERPPNRRLVLGVGVFALGWVLTAAGAWLIAASSLPTAAAGIVVFVVPKLGVLAAIAILGKPGFNYLKALVFGYLKPPAEVSPRRHRVGIAMFTVAMLAVFVEPYLGVVLPGSATRDLRVTLGVDLLLIASLLVLGGDFWDKIRALFIRGAKVTFSA